MTVQADQADYIESVWRQYMEQGDYEGQQRLRRIFRMLPGAPRCKNCYAPFKGLGSPVARIFYGKRPSKLNPRLCNVCEEFAAKHQGGAEIELSMLFVDVRGSTTLAEQMSPREFSVLINRFYTTAARVLVEHDALVDKIIGDQAAGMFAPGIAGPEHARQAIRSAMAIMGAFSRDDGQQAIPMGAGVHTGVAFVGSVGEEGGTHDITVLGDAANTAARLSTMAGAGEILVSQAAWKAAGLPEGTLEERELALKGKEAPVTVYVLTDFQLSI
jgi:adenylate cyclase